MTNWIEITLSVDGKVAEAIADLMQQYGHQGVAIEHEGILPEMYDESAQSPQRVTVRAFLPDDERAAAAKAQFEAALRLINVADPLPRPVYKVVNEEDWAEAWKVHYQPVRVGRRLWIRPLWIDLPTAPEEVVVALDPGMAFGTGTHPTTQLCLQALEDLVQPGMRMLDLGCGSGILAIAAAKLGAAQVVALDVDPIAVRATWENAQQNGVADRVIVQQGSLENVVTSSRRFDLVVVNILARIIIEMCDCHLGDTVRPGGKAVFSGIVDDQATDVEDALRKTGLDPYARRRQEPDWVLIEARRPHT